MSLLATSSAVRAGQLLADRAHLPVQQFDLRSRRGIGSVCTTRSFRERSRSLAGARLGFELRLQFVEQGDVGAEPGRFAGGVVECAAQRIAVVFGLAERAASSATRASSDFFWSSLSDSVRASSATWALSASSARFLPASESDSTNWPMAKISSTNTNTMISEVSASTNPGQMSNVRRRRRASVLTDAAARADRGGDRARAAQLGAQVVGQARLGRRLRGGWRNSLRSSSWVRRRLALARVARQQFVEAAELGGDLGKLLVAATAFAFVLDDRALHAFGPSAVCSTGPARRPAPGIAVERVARREMVMPDSHSSSSL